MTDQLSAPVRMLIGHSVTDFNCGEPILDEWLKRKAFPNQLSGASRTFVITDEISRVIGYYTLAPGVVTHRESRVNVKGNMPAPIPVIVMGRLAVDLGVQGSKLGAAMLKNAILRVHNVAENTRAKALVVHAFNEQSQLFYKKYGFRVSSMNPMILFLNLSTLKMK